LETGLVYGAYGLAAVGAIAAYVALPKSGRPPRWGLIWIMLALAIGALVMLLSQMWTGPGRQGPIVLLSLLAVGGALRVITHPKPVYAALYFVMVVLATAALAIAVGAEFLGVALVIVYAGAIMVTYVFVIMLAQQNEPDKAGRYGAALDYDRTAREPIWSVLAGFVLVGTIAGIIVGRIYDAPESPAIEPNGPGNTLAVGQRMLIDYAISVELAGILLMVAMVGAIAIAKKRLPRATEEQTAPPPGEIGKHVKPF